MKFEVKASVFITVEAPDEARAKATAEDAILSAGIGDQIDGVLSVGTDDYDVLEVGDESLPGKETPGAAELEELPHHSPDAAAEFGPAEETVRVMLPVLFCFNVRRVPGELPADFDGRVTDIVTNYLGILGEEDPAKCTLTFSHPDGKDLEANVYPSDHEHCDTLAWIAKEREAIEREDAEYRAAEREANEPGAQPGPAQLGIEGRTRLRETEETKP